MSIMKRVAIVIVLFLMVMSSLSSAGCTARRQVGAYSCSDLTDVIYGEKSLQHGETDFSNYDIDKQYAIYICGNQFVHPPMIYLGELFAREGNKVVAFLKSKLLEANDDLTVRDLVLVFSEMSRLKTYDVANDGELMYLISERVGGMKDPGWKQTTQEMVAEIKR
jgi:hypothetical protein